MELLVTRYGTFRDICGHVLRPFLYETINDCIVVSDIRAMLLWPIVESTIRIQMIMSAAKKPLNKRIFKELCKRVELSENKQMLMYLASTGMHGYLNTVMSYFTSPINVPDIFHRACESNKETISLIYFLIQWKHVIDCEFETGLIKAVQKMNMSSDLPKLTLLIDIGIECEFSYFDFKSAVTANAGVQKTFLSDVLKLMHTNVCELLLAGDYEITHELITEIVLNDRKKFKDTFEWMYDNRTLLFTARNFHLFLMNSNPLDAAEFLANFLISSIATNFLFDSLDLRAWCLDTFLNLDTSDLSALKFILTELEHRLCTENGLTDNNLIHSQFMEIALAISEI